MIKIGSQVAFYEDTIIFEGRVTDISPSRSQSYTIVTEKGDIFTGVTFMVVFESKEDCKRAVINNLEDQKRECMATLALIESRIMQVIEK